MYYKIQSDRILCVKYDDGTILFSPDTEQAVNNTELEWIFTDKKIIRLPDYTFVFENDERVLSSEKQIKLYELEASFDERVAGSFVCSLGYPMQFDRSDTLAVEGAIQLLKATEQTTGYLTDANDATHYSVPLATIEAVKVEMLAAYAQCHARKQELRAAINAAQNEEELNAIEITWPV